jgi:DNA-binding NtrC family response regulator
MAPQLSQTNLDMRRMFIIDDKADIQQFVADAFAGKGFTIESFATAKTALAALGSAHPAIIFLDLALLHSDAIDVLIGLGERDYDGVVYLMSSGRSQLIEGVRRLGARHGVRLAPPLSKPVERGALLKAVDAVKSHMAVQRPQRAASRV